MCSSYEDARGRSAGVRHAVECPVRWMRGVTVPVVPSCARASLVTIWTQTGAKSSRLRATAGPAGPAEIPIATAEV